MRVTSIEEVDKKKKKIKVDGEFGFMLYNSEVRKYHIVEGEEINPEDYEEIKAALYKRAKLKTMDLLKRSDKTEQELRTKLRTAKFSDDAIDVAIEYVRSYGYIDDARYASNFIRLKKQQKSKRALEFELQNKGIPRDIIHQCMEEEFAYEDETEAIKKLIRKKCNNVTDVDDVKVQKIIASICRKGFSFEKIRSAIRELEEEENL